MQQDMQKQQTSNGVPLPQLNGNSASNKAAILNGALDIVNPSVQLETVHKEMVRLIGQYLNDLGLTDTVQSLMTESGCRLDHPEACRFRHSILTGDWKEADDALLELQGMLDNPNHITEMRFLIREQKYLELIDKKDEMGALMCLRSELSPLQHNTSKVHKLSGLLFVPHNELKKYTSWCGPGKDSRQMLMDKLISYLPAAIMLPPRRLERLVIQALQHQISLCEYHNTSTGPLPSGSEYCYPTPSTADKLDMPTAIGVNGCLLTDHKCVKESFPSTCVHTISEHNDEVLIAAFSPDGRYLATGGKDCIVIIWDVDEENFNITRRHALDELNFSVVYLAWSHDSTKIIACMQEDSAECFVWEAESGKQVCKIGDSSNDSITCACWYKDDSRIACGGLRGQFYLCGLDGSVVERWEGVRVQSLACHADGKTILASDTHRRIRAYQMEEVQDENILQEDHGIMSFTVDSSGRFGLLNVTTQGVHLWDLQDKVLVRKYRGATQGHCTIHSCFGGLSQDYIASGSEDKKVYIWHRSREQPLAVLTGHTKAVNCVTWNPRLPSMLVSVSDDHSIKIWGPTETFRAMNSSPMPDDDYLPHSSNVSNGQLPHALLSNLDISEN